MGSVAYAKVKAVKTNSCFISLPKTWYSSKKNPPVFFEVVSFNSNKKIFVSWAGSTLEDDDTIGMNSLFINKLGLHVDQEVTVKEFTGELKQCSSAFIQPEESDDLRDLELVQDRLVYDLLDQIRVIWKGVTFPFWVGKVSFCVRVDEVQPSGQPVLLANRTELHVVLSPGSKSMSSPDLVDAGSSLSESVTEDKRSHSLGEETVDTSMGRFRKMLSLLWMDTSRPEPVASPTEGKELLSPERITLGLRTTSVPCVSCCVHCKENASPTTIYVSEAALVRRGYRIRGHFVASISKLLSPKEREEEKKSSQTEKGQLDVLVVLVMVSKVARLEGEQVGVPCTLRRLLGLERGSRLKITSVDYGASQLASLTLFPLSQLPLTVTEDKVANSFIKWLADIANKKPFVVTSGCLVHIPLEDRIKADFVVKVDLTSKPSSPLFPQPGQTVSSQDTNRNLQTFPPFCLLYPGSVSMAIVRLGKQARRSVKKPWGDRLPFKSVDAIDKDVGVLSLKQIGGVDEISERILCNLELWLGLNALSRHLGGVPPVSHSVLLCGRKGIGKSTLSSAICREMANRGVYVSIINCALLKGSSTKSIKRQLKLECAECIHRQPSLLVLDDVDVLTAAPTSPADEEGPLALYFSRNAQVVRRSLECALEKGVRLAAMATSVSTKSIHPSLVTSRGSHMFQDVVEMQPPNLEQRRQILVSVLQQKSPFTSEKDLHLVESVADSTEGYLALDLDTLVDRAKHATWMRTVGREVGDEGLVTDSDFKAARENFRPSSLRTLQLQTFSQKTWSDVGGLAEVRRTLMETLIWPTKYPALFEACPIRMQSSILLYGPPGTGKTLLAGVLATECRLNFISVKGPELLSKYTGASEQAVRDLFERAQSAKPCILFFDEFDALAPRRGHDNTGVTDRVVNQLLTQMDGVESLTGVYVLAATSRPDIIDAALLRPGRLDRCLYCPLPNQADREEILLCLSRHLSLDSDVDFSWLASRTEHFSGADLQALLYGAQLEALHSNRRGRHRSGLTSAPEEEFVCLTCDGSGKCELSRDDNQKILQQICTSKDKVLGIVDQHQTQRKKSSVAIHVSRDDIELSLSKTKPSVGPRERLHHQMLFESFSRGMGPPPPAMGERITLA